MRLAESAGVVLDAWQAAAVDDLLRFDDAGMWAAFEGAVIVPRQNGKGEILLVRELAGLFLLDEDLILHSAHEFKTAKEAFIRIRGVIESTPELYAEVKRRGGRVVGFRQSNEEVGIELRSGQRLRFVARSSGSGRGFTGDCVILDEAYNLSLDMMAALLPTLSAVPNGQLIYASSAPLPKEESAVLRSVCRRGRAGQSPSLAYLEWCAEVDPDPKDREAWAAANPAYPHRITEAAIERELEAFLADPELGGEESFVRERLGVWIDDERLRERVFPDGSWQACAAESVLQDPICLAFDVTPSRQSASIAAAGVGADGRVHLEVVDPDIAPTKVVERLTELRDRHGPALIVCAGNSPAASLKKQWESGGLDVTEATSVEHAQACGSLYDDVLTGKVVHIDQAPLNVAVDGAAKKDQGDGAWLWSRTKSSVNIAPLVAVTLAKWAHDHAPKPAPVPLVAWR